MKDVQSDVLYTQMKGRGCRVISDDKLKEVTPNADTKEVDEMITHNIFYTAITRARENLKVYWTPESQQKILGSFANGETSNDAKIFSARTGLKIVKKRVV